jgi:hypothetical protein
MSIRQIEYKLRSKEIGLQIIKGFPLETLTLKKRRAYFPVRENKPEF